MSNNSYGATPGSTLKLDNVQALVHLQHSVLPAVPYIYAYTDIYTTQFALDAQSTCKPSRSNICATFTRTYLTR